MHVFGTGAGGMLCMAVLFDALGWCVFCGAVLGFVLGGWLALHNEKKDTPVKNA